MELSVVVPVKNEALNIAPLVAEIHAALDPLVAFEIIYVDDGSEDDTVQRIHALQAGDPTLRLVRHGHSCGQSTAVWTGVKSARGRWIATLDGDGQNDPADIPALWQIAQAAIFTRISPWAGSASSTSSMAMGAPNFRQTAARVFMERLRNFWGRCAAISRWPEEMQAQACPGRAGFLSRGRWDRGRPARSLGEPQA